MHSKATLKLDLIAQTVVQTSTCMREEVLFVQLSEQLCKHRFWEQNQASIAIDYLHIKEYGTAF